MEYFAEDNGATARNQNRGNSIEKSFEIENMEWNLGAKR